jgi:methylmalonyl-CoA mutase cobalamin-binding subunit
MATCVVALTGHRVVFLGMSNPVIDIARTASQTGARAVVLSVSPSMDVAVTRRLLTELGGRLPVGVELVVGGAGAPRDQPGIVHMRSLGDLWEHFAG